MRSTFAKPLGLAFSVLLVAQAHAADSVVSRRHADEAREYDRSESLVEPVGDLALPQALALALLHSPDLKAYSWEARAQEAATLQASLMPNPTFGANAANFGNNSIRGFDGDVVTVELSQLIELGGKRGKRTQAASLTRDLAEWDYEAKRIDVLAQVSRALVDVIVIQQRLELAQQTLDLSEQVITAASARVLAGKSSPMEETKAKVVRSSVQIEMTRAQRELEAARHKLSANWGSSTPKFARVVGNLDDIQPLPSLDSLQQRLLDNPDLARWATEITQRQAVIEVEKSKAIPDVTATLGGSNYLMTNDYALVVGVSFPLPVFDRNQGGIKEAERRLTKAEEERRGTEVRITTALNAAYQNLDAAHVEIESLRENVLPGAQQAFDAAGTGYRLGKFSFMDVLDAQRALFAGKAQYLRALADYHQSVVDVERLIGGRLNEGKEPSKSQRHP
ncbi:TolC family protein [Methyloterricola oryzae]|uniref:TolC family protein n=1 Tax=Methyloterricola oryzae TaxID=1495050 RepID=UPI0005EBCEB3|nr:TolC family protein [Methyloterricola oryzae]